jgi:hypothetical protein
VEKALTRYRLVQKGVIDGGSAAVTHWMALKGAMTAMAAAADKASVAAGTMSPVQFAQGNSERAIAGIEAQQVAEKKSTENTLAGLANQQSAHRSNTTEWLTLQQQKDQAVESYYAKVDVLDAQLKTAIIAGESEVTAAKLRANDIEMSAAVSFASSNLKILESQFASTDQLRAGRLSVIQLQLAQELNAVDLSENQKLAIIRKSEAEKMAIATQYPTFVERQLQSIVASNAFSISQITTTWTSGLANAIVTGTDFMKAAWQSTQIAIVQGVLNTGVQLAAEWGLQIARRAGLIAAATTTELAAATTKETSKTTIMAAGEAARLGIAKATNALMAASSIATLGSMMAMGTAAISIMAAVMLEAAAMMSAIAASLAAGIVTAPLAGPVLAGAGILTAAAATMGASGAAAIQAAGGAAIVAATTAGAFAKGGIVTGPTLGLMGEAGSPEAAIPLNERGAKFMAQTMGLSQGSRAGGGSTSQTIIVELNGSPIMRMVADGLPSMLRLKGLPA